ncbi:MAG: OmpA family protein [Cytophagales bacterium]|nr:OmpA family protein [Cytophagales bacterium]
MNLERLFLFTVLLVLLIDIQGICQKKSKKSRRNKKPVREKFEPSTTNEIFKFKNINKIPYYYNEKELKSIEIKESAKDWEALFYELGNYIANFGIQNFYKDTQLLWRYAKLTELYGDEKNAKMLYRLVLKHHREDIKLEKLEIYYDSISKSELQKYVPIDYYYELIDYRRNVDTLAPPRGWQINMGHFINSEYSDYGPSLAIDGKTLIFTSKRNIVPGGLDTKQNEDIYFSTTEYNQWDYAQPITELNTIYNEGSVCLGKDGKTLYFARCDAPGSYGNCDLYVTHLQPDSSWSRAENLGVNVNSRAWDSHPSLSHNDDTLYFSSDRIGGFGMADIYFTSKDEKGNWLPAQNLGPIINSRNSEVSPFIHPSHQILYFSSNGYVLNFGEFDIYKSARINGSWQEADNIGPLINGEGSEFYFTIDSKSKDLFYARSIENDLDNLDLYSFPLPMEAQPLATTRFYGSLLDSNTGDPFERGIVSIIDLETGIEVAPQYLSKQGKFDFKLINNKQYLLVIQGDEFFRVEEIFFLDGDMELNMVTESIKSRLKFESIEFDNGSAELKTSMYTDLDKLSDFLLDNPDFKLKISGHTDSDGGYDFNMDLSNDRAKAISEYIIYFGNISAARIETFGYGSSQPIVEEKTEADKALNRRVEFELYRPSQEELKQMRQEMEKEEDEW